MRDEKDEEEVVGGVRSRPEETAEDAGVEARDAAAAADMEAWRARRVSRARPGLEGDLGGTIVDPEWQETEGEMEPRGARACCPPWLGVRGERQEDLGTCDNSPTNPGALLAGKSKGGLNASIAPGVKEYSPGK